MNRPRLMLAIVVIAPALVVSLPWSAPWLVQQAAVGKYRPQISFNATAWMNCDTSDPNLTLRQQMVKDIVENLLPGKTRAEIERLLGKSSTHLAMRRHALIDFEHHQKDANGEWEPFPQTGEGYYYDQYEWDMLYFIGMEQTLIFDHQDQYGSPTSEVLLIRLDQDGKFHSWFIHGSEVWRNIVSDKAQRAYRPRRIE